MSIIITIFAISFLSSLISWIGKSVLLDFAYGIHLRVFNSAAIARKRKLQAEILSTKAELLQTSAQDQFAKWAKLRRNVDKGLADLNKLNGEIATSKTAFSLKFSTFIWLLTTGLQFGTSMWYRRAPVFFLPPGWFGPLGWWFSLPFAPRGSVSVGVWQFACRRFLGVLARVVKDVYSTYQERRHLEAPRTKSRATTPVPS